MKFNDQPTTPSQRRTRPTLATILSAAAVLVLLAQPVAGFAAPPTKAKAHAAKPAKRASNPSTKFYDMGTMDIGGTTHRGDMAFLGREPVFFGTLLRLKKSFVHLIPASSKDLALR